MEKLQQARDAGKIAYFSHTKLIVKERQRQQVTRDNEDSDPNATDALVSQRQRTSIQGTDVEEASSHDTTEAARTTHDESTRTLRSHQNK